MMPDLVDDRVCPKTVKSALLGANPNEWALSIMGEITALCDVQAWRLAALGK